ncbi:hypothetical protein BGZ92_004273 [Podila epicladia]|nr:hypothetical protein BGZ92_004273 [Podila epicladia]
MSNIYLLEPHTSGKVILHTSAGDIAIELWPKEAPKACRNFIQLCMEGYYTNTIFHRIVAGFIIQGGDPEGTGEGGESVFEGGQPFADEFHTRLRFVRRGLVAMANSGQPNDNRSQFFITLDATPELQNKHTIFGKIGSLEVDANERPLYPPTVTGCTIVVNPFDDIVPRISRQEQEAARLRELEAQKKPEKQKKQKKNVALLSFADDAPDEDGENSEAPQRKKMMSSHDLLDEDPTLSKEVDSSLLVDLERKSAKSSKSKKPREEPKEESRKESRRDEDEQESFNDFDQRMRDQVRSRQDALQKKSKTSHESGTRSSDSLLATSKTDTSSSSSSAPSQPLTAREKTRQEIQKLENDIRKMHNRDSDDDHSSKKNKPEKISYLQLEREQYKTRKELSGDRSTNKRAKAQASADKERDMLDKLSAFERKVSVMAREPEPNPVPKKNDAPPCKIHGVPSCESCQDTVTSKSKDKRKQSGSDDEEDKEKEQGEEAEGDDSDDNDIGWMQHKLVFEKDLKGKEVSLSAKRDDYVVIDPLNKANATTKAIAMEKERNQDKRRKQNHYADKDSRGGRNGGRDDRDRRNRDGRDDRRPYDRPSSSSSSSRRDDRDRSDRHSDSRGSGRRDDYKDDYRREPGRANRDRW